MAEIAVNEDRRADAPAAKALKAAATAWFLIAFAGQWLFVFYILGFFGRPVLVSSIAVWSQNKNLIDGYIAGDVVGNAVFGLHVIIAAVLTLGATLQLV